MAKYLVSFEVEADEKSLEELRKLEHHAEYLLDLDSWPEVKNISGVKIVPTFKEGKLNGNIDAMR